VQIFSDPRTAPAAGANPLLTLTGNGIATPLGIFVNASTGEIWVANGGNNTCIRFPKYETLALNPVSNGTVDTISGLATLAVLQDQYGDLFVADTASQFSVLQEHCARHARLDLLLGFLDPVRAQFAERGSSQPAVRYNAGKSAGAV
jgi:hypothetical protein